MIIMIIVIVMIVTVRVGSIQILLVLIDHVPNVVLPEETVSVTFPFPLRSFPILEGSGTVFV